MKIDEKRESRNYRHRGFMGRECQSGWYNGRNQEAVGSIAEESRSLQKGLPCSLPDQPEYLDAPSGSLKNLAESAKGLQDSLHQGIAMTELGIIDDNSTIRQ
jgi:hypothetical protein